MLYRIVARNAVCGLIASDGVVVRAAPMFRWAVGKRIETVLAWCMRKGMKWEVVNSTKE